MAEIGIPSDSPLGEPTEYTATYTPSLLCSIERAETRVPMGIPDTLPFRGEDVWNGYEFTWLNERGKPEVAALRVHVPVASPCIVESKSLKLYLGSLAQAKFNHRADVLSTLNSDLGIAFRSPVMVEMIDLAQIPEIVRHAPGTCLDGLEVRIDRYDRTPELLMLDEGVERVVKETLHSNLFRSICPVTGQPDSATIIVQYLGRPVTRTALLAYLVSYRNHAAFHESTIEQIFMDLKARCRPDQLSVTGRFQRRGGIDINPFRSDQDDQMAPIRLPRQ